MVDGFIPKDVLEQVRQGDEVLDRGTRGPAAELALLGAAGLLAAPLPAGYGGKGWGTSPDGALAMLDVLIALGGVSLPVARIYEGHVNAIKLVQAYGSDVQRDRMAEAVHGGRVLGVWGADAADAVTVDATSGSLTGAKAFASGLADVGTAIVTARTAGGLQMILADVQETARHRPEQWDVDAMVGSRSGGFDCVGLPARPGDRLGAEDDLFREPDFQGGTWRLSACYAGALASVARLLAALMDGRGAMAAPLAMHRLGQVAMEAEGSALWARSACLAVESAGISTDIAVRTALFAREAVEQAAGRAMAIADRVGGTSVHRRGDELGRRMRDLRFYLRQADLDGKLALATGYWLAAGRDMTV